MEIVIPPGCETELVANLAPYARNARTHDHQQVTALAASIAEFGFCAPVGIRRGGILAGHGRVLAAELLGMDRVPIIRLDHLTDVQARAYVIADNQLATQAGWDMRLLAEELAYLDMAGANLDLLGFAPSMVEELLAPLSGIANTLSDALAPPAPAAPEPRQAPATPAGDVAAPAAKRVNLVLAMDTREDREAVLAFLNREAELRGLDDAGQALAALAAEG